jgi:hypothetical protein
MADGNSFALIASSDYAGPVAAVPMDFVVAILLIVGLAALIPSSHLKTRFLVRKDRGHKRL